MVLCSLAIAQQNMYFNWTKERRRYAVDKSE